jgi:hypothetical protein
MANGNSQGVISKGVTWLLGANWKTSLSGYVTILAYFVHDKPQVIQWIPEPTKGILWNAAEWIFLGGFLAFAKQVKDKNITGGMTQQTASGAVADKGTQTLVDETIKATIKSGEAVTPAQKQAAQS